MEKVFRQKEAVAAYKVLDKISGKEIEWRRISTLYGLMRLKRALQEVFDVQRACEQKLFEKYQPVQDGGQFQFGTPEKAQAFLKELEEISNIELTDLHVKPVNVTGEDDMVRVMTLADMDAMGDFIICEEEEEEQAVPELTILDPEEEEHGNA